jgi:hypothetical protein
MVLILATIGVATYPLHGIYKSVLVFAKPSTQQSIILARRIEFSYLTLKARKDGLEDQVVMQDFAALGGKK